MFFGAVEFNQDIGTWDVSNVLDMTGILNDATAFDKHICWDLHMSVSSFGYVAIFAGPRMSMYNTTSAACECAGALEHLLEGPGTRGTCSGSEQQPQEEEEERVQHLDTTLLFLFVAGGIVVLAGMGSCFLFRVCRKSVVNNKDEENEAERDRELAPAVVVGSTSHDVVVASSGANRNTSQL